VSSTRRAPLTETLVEQPTCELAEPSLIGEGLPTRSDVLPYLLLLWANRRLLWRAGLYAMVASTLMAFLIPVRYQSVTRLMPPENASASGVGMLAALAGRADMSALGGLAGDFLGMKSSGALFVGILSSDSVRDAVIEKFHLRKVYHTPKIEDARKALSEHTDISEDRKSGIISIMVTDHDPKRAAAMAQTYVSELDRLVAQVSTSSARRERIFLEGRLQSVKADLDTAARNFSEFASKNTAIDIPAQGKAMVEAAANLQGQLIAAEAERSGLQQIYTDSNVRVRAAEARVDELKRKLNEIGGAGSDGQSKSDNSLYPSIRKLPLLGVTYADLYRETKIQETVYELLTQQYELAKVQEAKEIPTVRVLDEAEVPTKKSFPPRTVIVVLGTTLGITLAMVWTTGKSRWEAVDASDPRKLFAKDVFLTAQARLLRFSWNSAAGEPSGNRAWNLWKKARGNGLRNEGRNRS
jgi:uncharacterized protein involved in exopolysaccharide biosynthesis